MRRGAAHGPKIIRIRTHAITLPLKESLTSSQLRYRTRETLLVEIEAENGVTGWGECAGPPVLLAPIVHSFYSDFLLGRDALQTDRLWHTLRTEGFRWGRRGLMVAALSGIDMALWDVKGKVLKRPCSEMMGGRAFERVPFYAVGLFFRDRPETELIPQLIDEAQGYFEQGFRGVKAQIGRNLSFDLALIRRLRENFPNATLMADAGHAYDLAEAIQVGNALADAKFAFQVDPLSPEFPDQNRILADRVPIPLYVGKWEQTRWGYQHLLQSGGVACLQLNLAFCGGPTEALRIRNLAQSFGINTIPAASGTMLHLAAALHFVTSEFRVPGRLEPTVGMMGWPVTLDPLTAQTFADGVTLDHGLASVPPGPGWGVTIHRDRLDAVCVRSQESGL
ncbi:MAG: mandelate racemase/muconate lactonizing enzyme family protein [Capsulimonadales bacterium]|nr:mandelate racemase/muconate lactonizing enzyme family protein [Capsulimonadales bacterium]